MKMPFLFGIHCHQPVGNFHEVVDEAVAKSYAPFMETAIKFPKFRFAAHYSGWLLEYIRTHHTDLFKNMQKLSSEGQIEFFTGGYYEPVLSAIPSRDRQGQIEKLNAYIKNHFGQTPDGLWLTERVWDSSIIPDAVAVGIKNIIVDDYHFISAGYYKEHLNGYYTTEQDGERVNLFPIDKNLRYIIPFKEENDIVDYLEKVADEGGKCSVIFDDGEKFGIWPKTYEWVYEKGWLERFLQKLTDSDKTEFSFFSEAVKNTKPSGLAYLPITSYYEMGEWSLFSSRTEQLEELRELLNADKLDDLSEAFVRGGIWKNFFAKYPESNRIHKRALRLSRFANQYNDPALTEALYKAQCNDALWHGIFGGLYLPNLRNNSWSFLIEGEKEFERVAGLKLPLIETEDLDYDGYDDAYLRTSAFNASFTSRDGGQMTSFELKRNNVNFGNTISRRKEAYHSVLLQDKLEEDDAKSGISTIHDLDVDITDEMKEMLVYDWYNKNSFIDHITDSFDTDSFAKCSFNELADFANSPTEMAVNNTQLIFKRSGAINFKGESYNAKLVKRYSPSGNGLEFEISIESDCNSELVYVCELNFHFWDMKNIITSKTENKFSLSDNITGTVIIESDKITEAETYIFSTISQSEKGIDLTEQGLSVFVPIKFRCSVNLKGKLTIN